MKTNKEAKGAVSGAVCKDVYGDLFWAVDLAVYGAVDRAVWWALDEAVDGAVCEEVARKFRDET